MAFMSVTGTCISFCIIRFEHYQPTRFRLVFSCTLSFFQYTVIVTSSEQIVIDITKSHPTKTRKPCVTFLPNVPNAAKSSNRPGRRKTKEEKNTNALSLNVPYAKKTWISEPTNVSFNLPKKRNDLDTLKKNEMLASNDYSVKAFLCQRWTLMN